ncbi:MAG: bifunctional adenosylcobinamide kinase/adenosylcobinamide-phosphate guanylyltransferase [Tissierellia bacterium]|nr:bifunctional adenosylcobinamide kinase/adenosylcobinamide-phosphate guanylyltransferase [Tissierellia bacterium]
MITLVTGGARSGKSNFAESLLENRDDVVYIATSIVADKEMEERVKHHKDNRPSIWRTFEGYTDLDSAVGSEEYYLLECLTVMTSNIMYDYSKDYERIPDEIQKQIEDVTVSEIKKLLDRIKSEGKQLIIVTNEVGSSIVPLDHISRVYRDVVGRVNQRVAALSDSAYLVVCGLEVKLK